ncbi:MAG: tRNA (adenosine(37)-N6)-threonylcarbamoyltransferase complex ATPase subunit type 1 TsaE [Patescibacteria group bacterium]|nr:tRNA (adenosine(37)-N6)-threonylcarbamoyltransferase complex ATPase subunit type 1 TsaE [Patescibacteria group bacterium]
MKQTRLVTIKHDKLVEQFKVVELDDWKKVADALARLIEPGFIVALSGPLGAGKTTLTQYLAALLGAPKRAISPTFALMRIYNVPRTTYDVRRRGSKSDVRNSAKRTFPSGLSLRVEDSEADIRRLVHVDAYRIEDEKDLVVLDLDEELSEPGTVVLIEWPENARSWLKKYAKQTVQVMIELI